jgi:hypothetical protein
MIQHVSAITNQIETDCHSLFDIPIPFTSTSDIYTLGRLSLAGSMTVSLLRMPFSSSPLDVAGNIGMLVLAHDLFQIFKNRQELEQNPLCSLKIVAAAGKGIFSGGKTFFKSVLKGKSDDEVAMNTFRAGFNQVAALQSKNTFLKPFWNEIQFQLAIRG